MRAILLAMVALAGCAAEAPTQVVERRTTMAPAPRGEAPLRTAMLRGHNAARDAVGVAPLLWDDRLATDAAAYAATLARKNRFEHAAQPQGSSREGENLWMGTLGAYRYDEMLGHWIDERLHYRPAPTPDFSTTGRWGDVAHYTQMVWRNTTAVGCALASNRDNDYLVCRYAPAGNVVGQRAF
ncbi:CAP domain-containing protein [Sphingomonas sp. AR_OL41]|uniref:CAP domain-containing protein n=1 Tax=Sphingomonas sp. AR_OL41 TaxID=3042729 RepID=UPI00248180B7|nr:CAP domain-containing protein [Sphingomonas sp. AR_OL41]MDH7975565.1 CAP domain-containing protein [Sphingomonas sp. AR_OL41]